MRLTDTVCLVGGAAYGISAPGDCNVYLIDGRSEYALVDAGAGLGVSRIVANIEELELDLKKLKTLFLTHSHFDHIGGAQEMQEKLTCKTLVHREDAESIKALGENVLMDMAKQKGINFKAPRIDRVLSGNEVVKVGDIDVKIIHTPGHTPGCISLSLEERDGKKAILTGDIASTNGRLGFINGPGFDLNAWKSSLKKLLNERPERLYPGHNTFMLSNAVEDLKIIDQKMNSPWTTIVTAVG